jgi:hypothetical protein
MMTPSIGLSRAAIVHMWQSASRSPGVSVARIGLRRAVAVGVLAAAPLLLQPAYAGPTPSTEMFVNAANAALPTARKNLGLEDATGSYYTLGSGLFPRYATATATTATTTNGSPTITVTSASNISLGDQVTAAFAPSLTYVANISGTTVTLSANATATNASPAAVTFGANRFSAGATVLTNAFGAEQGYFGQAAQGRSTWLAQFFPGLDTFGSEALVALGPDGGDTIIGGVRNNLAAATMAFPTGVTGVGVLESGAAGNAVFGIGAQVWQYDAGVATNELNTNNYFGAPSSALPPDRSIGTAQTLPIVLTLAPQGSYASAIDLQLGEGGAAPQPALTGIYMNPGAVSTTGLYIDSSGTTGPTTDAVLSEPGAGINLQLHTTDTMVATNSVITAQDHTGAFWFYVKQNGDLGGGQLLAGYQSTYSLALNGGSTYTALNAASGATGILVSPNNNGSNASLRLSNTSTQAMIAATDPTGIASYILQLGGSETHLQVGGTDALALTASGITLSDPGNSNATALSTASGNTTLGESGKSVTLVAPKIGSAKVPATNASQKNVSAPSGTTSTTGVMMGLAGAITPATTGNILIIISGDIASDTSGDGAKVQLRYGTGSAPTNAAALTGTTCGGLVQDSDASGDGAKVPFSVQCIATDLSTGTAYWLDVELAAVTGGTAAIADISLSAHEL